MRLWGIDRWLAVLGLKPVFWERLETNCGKLHDIRLRTVGSVV